jgi:hypothetical protein
VRCAQRCSATRSSARVGPQKGADPRAVELEQRLLRSPSSSRIASAGVGCGQRLRAAFAALGGTRDGAALVLDDPSTIVRGTPISYPGEGVSSTGRRSKGNGAVVRRCGSLRVRCELFGGVV